MSEQSKSGPAGPPIQINKDLVRELADLLEETGLTEIEVSEQGRSIRVARQADGLAAALAAPRSTGEAPAPSAGAQEEDLSANPGAVTSPMVGTVYTAPEPGASPFIKVGDQVSEGDTVLIVEAMKTMNPILAPHGGTVSRILVSNGAPVEYGEVLMILD